MTLRHPVSGILFPLLVLTLFLLSAGTRPAHADYYKYTDKTGAICISNTLDAVPPQYRASMKVIREETLEQKDRAARQKTHNDAPAPAATGAEPAPADAAPAAPRTAAGRLFARFPWLPPLLFAGAALLLFFLVRKLAQYLPSPLLARVIYLVFFVGVFVFAYKCYADHLADDYVTIKSRILVLFEKANRRE